MHLPAVSFSKFPHDRQPQPQAARGAATRRIHSVKAIKQPWQMVVCYALPIIAHGQGAIIGGDRNRAPVPIAQRVADQIT